MQTQTVLEYYGNDHLRLDAMLHDFQDLKEVNFEAARRAFDEFKADVEQHILWEEKILFPLFEAKTGVRGEGPIQVMRIEHRQIRQLLEEIGDKLAHRNPATDAEQIALMQVMSPHSHKEELIVYSALDRMLTEPERGELFSEMHRMRPATTAANEDVRELW